MTRSTTPTRRAPSAPGAVVVAGLAVIATGALWLVLTENTGIRYSADHDDTVPMWQRWPPLLVGLLLVRLVPPPVDVPGPARTTGEGSSTATVVLVAAAAAFAVSLWAVGGGEPAHTLLKVPLLLGVPLVLFAALRRGGSPWRPPRPMLTGAQRLAPAVPVGAWLVLAHASPLALPTGEPLSVDPATLLLTVAVVFVVNALLEEVFYRRWLQTSLERDLGRWPAIVVAALLWAVWHVGIQGTGRLDIDSASAVVNQGVLGLFLGYLWSRYRSMWPVLVVHGALNAAPVALSLL